MENGRVEHPGVFLSPFLSFFPAELRRWTMVETSSFHSFSSMYTLEILTCVLVEIAALTNGEFTRPLRAACWDQRYRSTC